MSAPNVQYTTTIRLEYPHEPGWLAKITAAIAERGQVRDPLIKPPLDWEALDAEHHRLGRTSQQR